MPPKGIEALVGGEVRVGCVVNPPNRGQAVPEPLEFWENAFLGLVGPDLVLVRLKRGLTRMKPAAELARIPASAVTGVVVGASGLQRPLRLDLVGGQEWSFGLSRFEVGRSQELFAALGVTPAAIG